jgi:hypothetical protein
MKVHEIMICKPACCGSDTNLAAATALLWDHDCGALPVDHTAMKKRCSKLEKLFCHLLIDDTPNFR